MFNIKKILKELNDIPKVKYPITYSKAGILFYNYSNIVSIICIILLLLAFVFGLLFKYFQYQFFIILTFVFSYLSVFTLPLVAFFYLPFIVIFFITRKNESYQILITEVEHNEKYAINMLKYSYSDIEYAIYHLTHKIDKLESRLVTFLGNKNVVIFTVYSMSLTFFNQLGGLDNLWTSFNQTNLTLSSVNLITLFGFAFFIGLILGCFILNSNISQYRDKVSLLKLTLKILSIT